MFDDYFDIDDEMKASQSPLITTETLPEDFWGKYQRFQEVAQDVELSGGHFTVEYTDQKGKKHSFKKIHFLVNPRKKN